MNKLLSSPFAKEKTDVVLPAEQNPEILASDLQITNSNLEPGVDELGRLRDILFGSQTRTTEKRLSDLETGLQAARRELSDALHDKIDAASGSSFTQLSEARNEFNRKLEAQGTDQVSQLRAVQKDLAERLEKQNTEQTAQTRATHKELSDGLDRLQADFVRQLRAAQKELSDQIAKLSDEQAERMRSLQAETRQRDDTLRQELLAMAASIENKKTSRQDLGQMLVEMGLRLRRDSDSPSA
jgi:uncharacterized phage infection (PIP) family protein YhgE